MFDLIVFCPGQTRSNQVLPKGIFVEIEQRYCDIWKFITVQKGVWYNLLADENEIGGTKICESLGWSARPILLESDVETNAEINESLTPYRFHEKYKKQVESLLEHFLESSPFKVIYILARYQSLEKEIVQGTYTLSNFLRLMEERKIYSNICYILSKHPNALDDYS